MKCHKLFRINTHTGIKHRDLVRQRNVEPQLCKGHARNHIHQGNHMYKIPDKGPI